MSRHDARTERRTRFLRRIATPYSLLETRGVIRRNRTGVDTVRNAGIVTPMPQDVVLQPDASPTLRVGFVGDIMNIDRKSLGYGDALREYLSSCDILIGNFEATIHDVSKRPGVWLGFEQPQAERIVDDLAALFDPSRFFLSLANNHSGDYPKSVFDRSCAMLRDRGFTLFGMIDTPFVDVAPALRIVTGTTWSNQRADDMLYLHAAADADRFRREGAVNILYPHWGYELEAWPRPEIVAAAQRFAAKYDAIVGHHAHNPQPVATIDGTPVAFGLGDFCFYYDLPTYRHGLVCRMDVTDAAQGGGTPRISALDWRQITSSHTGNDITVNLADKTLRWLR